MLTLDYGAGKVRSALMGPQTLSRHLKRCAFIVNSTLNTVFVATKLHGTVVRCNAI